ncbi:MAG TPA: MFS transporter, partial [Pseudomonas sp.]|nr:MFS transporter [Pseudomonas sp.]
ETVKVSQEPVQQPIRKVLSIRTFWWLVMAGLAFNFATYACNAFMVPLLMRYHGVSLVNASVATGVIVGLTGLIGLTLG